MAYGGLAGLAAFGFVSAQGLYPPVEGGINVEDITAFYQNRTGDRDGGVSFHPAGSSKGFVCKYPFLDPAEWEGCNTISSRHCWLRQKKARSDGKRLGFDIRTDYEKAAPVGVTRRYTLDVVENIISPDGVPKETLLFNGQYPGPKIEACWGDEISVTVTNFLSDMGTQIHWHGIRQLFTNDMDGVAVVQCPIARGGSFTYTFRATQYGTAWYHSHYSLQYAEGLEAPLVIYGPSSANYDISVHEPLLMTDWVHNSAFDEYENEKDPIVRGAIADNILLNGKGRISSVNTASTTARDIRTYSVTRFAPGKRHRLRVINGAAGTAFVFSIDGHKLTVIANDFVAVEPYVTDSLIVNIGQRYDIIVQGLDNPIVSGNYWIRTQPADGCNRFRTGTFNSQASPPVMPFDVRTGVIHYETDTSVNNVLPLDSPSTHSRSFYDCADLTLQRSLKPVVPWTVEKPVNSLATSTFYLAHQKSNDTSLGQLGNYAHWMLRLDPNTEAKTGRQMHSPFWIDFSNPTLLNLTGAPRDPNYNVIRYSSRDRNGFIYMVMDGALLPTTTDADVNNTFSMPPTAHPFHWHGSDVVIIGQDKVPFDPLTTPLTWRFDNPPRRDTVTAPAGGYVAVAFKPDNPGVWLAHCHIAWHASAGLALQMIVQDDKDHIYRTIGQEAIDNLKEGCRAWKKGLTSPNFPPIWEKDDSGV
ncbi:multicopper oxidase-domain-containing protein [Podospora appendiculata]|uniref:Multicopper oxidase-domain-containing protein n=1 Tax=Podospora appendiculata TaxID=314037 RepID=A0AAE0WYQ2_9PEZI|nr:multicopper oxidase-domain-containing protein [Podospora appendiculata]KAK3689929.1 multicopper oxidase-domain-containing protein [Podospora appendiculata]